MTDADGDVVVGGDGFGVANERFVLLLARYRTR